MTPDHHKYFSDNANDFVDPRPLKDVLAITESQLYPVVFSKSWHFERQGLADSLRFYRVPGKDDGFGVPPLIELSDIREGDKIIAIGADKRGVYLLQFWYVTKIEDNDAYYIVVDNYVGMASFGETLHDKFAGALGLIPTE
ncbi:MAG TPA: hypothetical protein VHC22_24515 [Pirellulales bacterium]|nr:hypothetical protein [Pirellulales bacterium]